MLREMGMNVTQAESAAWSPLNPQILNSLDFGYRNHVSYECLPALHHASCVTVGKSPILSEACISLSVKKNYHSSILTSCHEN